MRLSRFVTAVAVLLTVYQLAIGYTGVPPSLQHRPISIGVVLLILFLTIDSKGNRTESPSWTDVVLGVGALAASLFVSFNYQWFLTRFMLVTPLKPMEMVCGIAMILLVLEAGRRTLGWVLPALSILFIAYGALGHLVPGILHHTYFTPGNIVEDLYMSTEGFWGSPTHSAATFVFMFVIFGSLLNETGMGSFFTDAAASLTGRYSGGPAKASVVSSALMGTIQGSSITNVVTTGVFTIPAMKSYGFPPHFAGAVEAAASCGGQITPPVLGAAAFIMADMTGIPYIEIVKHSLIPALLYYVCVFTQIHLRSKRLGLKGLPNAELPRMGPILKKQGVFLIPIIMLVILMVKGYSPMRAGFVSVVTIFVLALVTIRNRKKLITMFRQAMDLAPRQMCAVAAAVLNAGIIIGILQMTGLGMRMSSLIIDISGGSLTAALVLSMFMAIVLGMGMPTSGAYIIMGTLLAPGLVRLGLTTIQAHMFVFFFACMSMITPPVAVAAYAAAGIAEANPSKVGLAAWKLALAAFVVPFMFAFCPELLSIGSTLAIIRSCVTASIGCIFLACAVEGRIFSEVSLLERALVGAAAFMLIESGIVTDLIGLALGGTAVVSQVLKQRAAARTAG